MLDIELRTSSGPVTTMVDIKGNDERQADSRRQEQTSSTPAKVMTNTEWTRENVQEDKGGHQVCHQRR